MPILTESRILESIKNYYPKFEGEPWNIEIDYRNRKINAIQRDKSSSLGKDILFQLLGFEKIQSEIVLYHYRNPDYLEDIRNGITRIDSLNKYLDVLGGDKRELSVGIESFYQSIDTSTNAFSNYKKEHFIFCLTDIAESEHHYQNFGKACIKFRYQPTNATSLVKLYKIKYLDDLRPLLALREEILDKYNMELNIRNGFSIAPFVKTEKHRIESEYRLMFDTHQEKVNRYLVIDEGESEFLESLNRNELYLEMPLINPLFKLTVEDITVKQD